MLETGRTIRGGILSGLNRQNPCRAYPRDATVAPQLPRVSNFPPTLVMNCRAKSQRQLGTLAAVRREFRRIFPDAPVRCTSHQTPAAPAFYPTDLAIFIVLDGPRARETPW